MADDIPIKVCGITRLEDAQLAFDLGAFALGFIFYKKSPRYVTPEKAQEILGSLAGDRPILKVGVFVNSDEEELRQFALISGIDILQLHGDESPEFLSKLRGLRLWKAIRLQESAQLEGLDSYAEHVEAFLFDAAVSGQYGGTGHQIDRPLIEKIPRRHPFLLAGGLDPSNARPTFERFRPYALDLSSGVESSPGIKDPLKLKALFAK